MKMPLINGWPGNDDAILRWNACARIIMSDSDVAPAEEEAGEQMLGVGRGRCSVTAAAMLPYEIGLFGPREKKQGGYRDGKQSFSGI